MFIKLLYTLLYLTLVSCNVPSSQADINVRTRGIDTLTEKQKLTDRAKSLYDSEKYSQAKLCYDTLILLDSTEGEYYFRRGYCKSISDIDILGAIKDYSKSIEHNYNKKQKAYLNIGVLHRSNAVFRSSTNSARIVEYNKALHFFNECLRIEPENEKALREKKEVEEILRDVR